MGDAVAPLTALDIPELHGLVERAYRGDSARVGWTHEADLLGGQRTDIDALAEIIADPDQAILGLRRDGRLVGCVQVTRKDSERAYLGMLSVEPELQAAGLGRALIAAAESHARDGWRCSRMEMTVIRQRAELIAYYERRGYVRTGEEAPFPATNPRFGLPKRDDLGFVVLARPLSRRSSVG